MPPSSKKKTFFGFTWGTEKTSKSDHVEPNPKERHYDSINRPVGNHVMIVLYGKSGSGKTQTIQHFFGHNKDIVFPDSLQTSDRSSETRETVEYVLEMESADSQADINNLTLGIVDTPGLDDTAGPQQDTWNMESIKEFLRDHRYLRTGDSGRHRFPNVVLFVINGTDKRLIGKDTQLTRGLRNLHHLQLTDWTNLVIVVTNALSIDNSNKTWGETARRLTTDIQKFTYKEIGRKVPVVLLENCFSPERMNKVGKDWTELPDKTLQPRNLFDTIQVEVLYKKEDVIGRMAVRGFFARSKNDSHLSMARGRAVSALRSGDTGSFGMDVNQRYEDYKLNCVGYREQAEVLDDDSGVEELVAEPRVEKSSRADNCSAPNINQREPDLESEDYLIGRCFNIKDGKMLREQIFRGDCVKAAIEVMPYTSTTSKNEKRVNEERLETDRGGQLTVVGAEGQRQSMTKKMNRLNCTIWKLRVTQFRVRPKQSFIREWHNQANLDINFAADLKKLPKKFDLSKRERYEKFFSAYGVGFVCCAYVGGEATVTSVLNEDDNEASSRQSVDTGSVMVPLGNSLPQVLCKLGIKTSPKFNSSNSSSNYDISFQGGRQEFQGEDTAEEWKRSVADNPSAFFLLDVEDDVVLYHDFILKLNWLNQSSAVAKALKEAYEDFYVDDRKKVAKNDEKKDDSILSAIFKRITFSS